MTREDIIERWIYWEQINHTDDPAGAIGRLMRNLAAKESRDVMRARGVSPTKATMRTAASNRKKRAIIATAPKMRRFKIIP